MAQIVQADRSPRTPQELAQLDERDLMALRRIAVQRIDALNDMADALHENAPASHRADIEGGLKVWWDAIARYDEAEQLRDEEWNRLANGDFSSYPGLV